jgi:hypothetical protein
MSYELSGKLVAKYEVIQRSESFKTREFVVEKTDDVGGRVITNYIKFQCVQDKTAIIENINPGDDIKVYFNVKGNKWEKDGRTNYITNLDAWKIEQVFQNGKKQSSNDGQFEPLDTFSSQSPDAVDDLPF